MLRVENMYVDVNTYVILHSHWRSVLGVTAFKYNGVTNSVIFSVTE